MKKILLSLALVIIIGDFTSSGYFDAPTGERVYWDRFGSSVGVFDTNGRCVWNDGEPRDCTFQEFSILLYAFSLPQVEQTTAFN